MGLAGLIVGVVGFALVVISCNVPSVSYLIYGALGLGLISVVLSAVARHRARKESLSDIKATFGLIMGIVTIAITIVVVALSYLFFLTFSAPDASAAT